MWYSPQLIARTLAAGPRSHWSLDIRRTARLTQALAIVVSPQPSVTSSSLLGMMTAEMKWMGWETISAPAIHQLMIPALPRARRSGPFRQCAR